MTDKPTDVPPHYMVEEDDDGEFEISIAGTGCCSRAIAIAACHTHRAAVTAEAVEEARRDERRKVLELAEEWERSDREHYWMVDAAAMLRAKVGQ